MNNGMKNQQIKELHIAVVEGDHFYHKIIQEEIRRWEDDLLRSFHSLRISSFIHADDFALNFHQPIDLVLMDYHLPGNRTSTALLRELKQQQPNVSILIVCRENSLKSTAASLLNGADEFIYKGPDFTEKLTSSLKDILHHRISRLR